MITLTREEAQQVLDALEGSIDAQEWDINDHITKYGEWYRPKRVEYMKQQLANTNSTIETLRARLAQTKHWSDCAVHSEPAYPAGECDCGLVPVAWADKHDIEREGHDFYVNRQQPAKDGVPLYTTPPQREWQGLTLQEIEYIESMTLDRHDAIRLAAVALQEKNGG